MKKLLIALAALAIAVPATTVSAEGLTKSQQKEIKVKLKELKKNKWESLGTRTVEGSLTSHYEKLNKLGEDGREVLGISTRTKSKNTGMQQAKNNAANLYAADAASSLQARLVADLQANGVDTEGEFDHFYGAFERLIETEINGEIQPSFYLIRTNPDGSYEVQCYCIVSESAASKARIRAAENALKESEAAQKYADKIAGFVRAGF